MVLRVNERGWPTEIIHFDPNESKDTKPSQWQLIKGVKWKPEIVTNPEDIKRILRGTRLECRPSRSRTDEELIAAAKELAKKEYVYQLFCFNCQHVAFYFVMGKAWSPEVALLPLNVILAFLCVILVLMALRERFRSSWHLIWQLFVIAILFLILVAVFQMFGVNIRSAVNDSNEKKKK